MALSLSDFLVQVSERHLDPKRDERYGQALFNVLYQVRPDLSEQIRGTRLDPFYAQSTADQRLEDVREWLMDNWEVQDE